VTPSARICVVLAIASTFSLHQDSEAAPLRGLVNLSSSFPTRTKVSPPGFWQPIPNEVLRPRPPLVDPRESMIVVLAGSKGKSTTRENPKMVIQNSRVTPAAITTSPGTEVVITNKDGTLHILEALDKKSTFPTGKSLSSGQSLAHKFKATGIHRFRCAEAPHVIGTIFVSSGAQAVRVSAGGQFRFANAPEGKFELKVLYLGKWIHRQNITIKGRTTVDINLSGATLAQD
jgi:plastocyanin